MASSNNINGMKAQDWKLLDTSSIDAAAQQVNNLTVEQQQLLNSLTEVIKASAQEIHGTSHDDRYRYIVDLIVRRLSSKDDAADNTAEQDKQKDNNDSSSSILNSKLADKICKIAEDLSGIDIDTIKNVVDDALKQISEDGIVSSVSKLLKQNSIDQDKARQNDILAIKTFFSDSIQPSIAKQHKVNLKLTEKTEKAFSVGSKIIKSVLAKQKKLQDMSTMIAQTPAFAGAHVSRDKKTGRFIALNKTTQTKTGKSNKVEKTKVAKNAKAYSSIQQQKKQIDNKTQYIVQKNDSNQMLLKSIIQLSDKLNFISDIVSKIYLSINKLNAPAKTTDETKNIHAKQQTLTTENAENIAQLIAQKSIDIMQDEKHKNKDEHVEKNKKNKVKATKEDIAIKDKKKNQKNTNSLKKTLFTAMSIAVKPLKVAILSVGSSISAMSKKLLKAGSKSIFAMLMTPPGLFAIGFVAGYVWTRWLKKWVTPIVNIVSKMSKSKLIAAILGVASIAGLAALILPAVLPMLMSGLLPAIGSLFSTLLPAIMSALPVLAPIALIASAVFATHKAIQHLNAASNERDAGIQKDNETTAKVIKDAKVQAQKSKEIRQKLDAMEDGDEKAEAIKERLEKLRKTKELYRKLEIQEKEAQEERQKLNSGFRKFIASADEIKHWQEKENSLREQKMRLLKDQGFAESDMRTKAARWDKDKMTEEQRLAKQLAEQEIKKTGDLSKDTYKSYAKAFGLSQTDKAYNKNKDKLLSEKFSDIKKNSNAQNSASKNSSQMQQKKDALDNIDKELQQKADQQQTIPEKHEDKTKEIADAMQKNAEQQKSVGQQILEGIESLKQLIANYNQPTEVSNTQILAFPNTRQNLATIENRNFI